MGIATATYSKMDNSVGSRGAVVSAALLEQKVAGLIPTMGDFHTVGPCKKAVFACLATEVKSDTFTLTFNRCFFHIIVRVPDEAKFSLQHGCNALRAQQCVSPALLIAITFCTIASISRLIED